MTGYDNEFEDEPNLRSGQPVHSLNPLIRCHICEKLKTLLVLRGSTAASFYGQVLVFVTAHRPY